MSKCTSSPLENGEILSDQENHKNDSNKFALDGINDGEFISIKPSQISAKTTSKSLKKFSKTDNHPNKSINFTKINQIPQQGDHDDDQIDEALRRKIDRAKQLRLERQGNYLREIVSSSSDSESGLTYSEPKIVKNDNSPKSHQIENIIAPQDCKIPTNYTVVEQQKEIPKNVTVGEHLSEISKEPPVGEHQREELSSSFCESLPCYFPAIQGCRFVDEYTNLSKVEEGSYGVVFQARDKTTGELVALKRLKMENEKDGFPITSLREVSTLLKAPHENIVRVREIVVGSHIDRIYVVMDFVQTDLKSLINAKKQPFRIAEVKCLLKQLLTAVDHIHSNWILHRDIKTSNILISDSGVLKLADFGSAREYGSPLQNYTPLIVTLWYRCPELLLGIKKYSTKVDIWSVGCVFAEMLLMQPLWCTRSEISQLQTIFRDLGSPNEQIWPGFSELEGVRKIKIPDYPYNSLRNRFGSYLSDSGFKLLNSFFRYCPERRISAEQALGDEYFLDEPRPIHPSMMPIDRFLADKPLTPKRMF